MGKATVKPKSSKSKASDLNTTQNLTPEKTAAKKPRNRKPRKLEYKWKDEEIKALIAAVQEHPVLWSAGVYYSSRKEAWIDIFKKLNIKGIDHEDKVQAKWDSLRSAFVRNNATTKVPAKQWRFAKYMSFLKTIKKKQPLSKEEPSLPLSHTIDITNCKRRSRRDMSTPIDGLSTPHLEASIEIRQPSKRICTLGTPKSSRLLTTPPLKTNVKVSQSNKDHFMKATSTSASPHGRPVLTSLVPANKTTDYNSSFCDHLLTELSTLSELKARRLRRLLMQVVCDFLNTPEVQPTRQAS